MANRMFKRANLLNTAKNVLHNKYVLYFVFAAALIDLLHASVKQDYLYCTLFVLIGFLTAFFNKNMIVILVVTMATATIIRSIIRGTGVKVEGLETKDDEDTTKDTVKDAFKDTAKDTTKKPDDSNDAKDATSTSEKSDKPDNHSNVAAVGANLSVDSSGVKGSTLSSSKTMDKTALYKDMQKNAVELMSVQKDIINGFQTIEPHMSRAESLIGSIQQTAETIQGMRTQQGFKSR